MVIMGECLAVGNHIGHQCFIETRTLCGRKTGGMLKIGENNSFAVNCLWCLAKLGRSDLRGASDSKRNVEHPESRRG